MADHRGLVLVVDLRRRDDAAGWVTESLGVQLVELAGEPIRPAKACAGWIKGGWPFLMKVDAAGITSTESRR